MNNWITLSIIIIGRQWLDYEVTESRQVGDAAIRWRNYALKIGLDQSSRLISTSTKRYRIDHTQEMSCTSGLHYCRS